MIVKGFYHILLQAHWYSIVIDQLRILLTSGLYDECEEISIGCIGTPFEKANLEKFVVNLYPKLKIKAFSENPISYEFLTLRLIEADVSDYVGFYFHLKGITKPNDIAQNNQRVCYNEYFLNQWRLHKAKIEEGYDMSVMNHLGAPLHPEHFSGNTWWFNRRYFDKLPKIDSLRPDYRWDAEQWACRGHGNYFEKAENNFGDIPVLIDYKHENH